jgi:hypothetical protein
MNLEEVSKKINEDIEGIDKEVKEYCDELGIDTPF